MNVSGEPKETAVSERSCLPTAATLPSAMNGDFGTSPPNGGRPSDESAQLISHQRAWQRVRIAVIFPTPQVHCVVSRCFSQEQRLDHAPQQADEMCHDLGVCRVFKGIAVNDPGAGSRTWVTS